MAWSPEQWTGHLGRVVTLRYRMHGDPEHLFSEAVGVVRSVGRNERGLHAVEVLNRRGEVRSIPLDDVLEAKALPR